MSFGPLVVSITGKTLKKSERELLSAELIGGLILFQENIYDLDQLSSLIHEVKSISPKILIFIDQEGGRVTRIKNSDFPFLDSQRKYFSEDDSLSTGRRFVEDLMLVNKELINLGVHVNLAPVLDSYYEHCPVIGALGRSFDREPQNILNIARETFIAAKELGMPTVGKHFPDHGFTTEDSHIDLPHDNRSVKDLSSHMRIYEELIQEQLIDIIMPAHVIYDNIDENNPATFSPIIINNILREVLKFNNVIMSDCLSMGAVRENDLIEMINKSIEVGMDMVTVSHKDAEQLLPMLDKIIDNSQESKNRISRIWTNRNIKTKHAKKYEDKNTCDDNKLSSGINSSVC